MCHVLENRLWKVCELFTQCIKSKPTARCLLSKGMYHTGLSFSGLSHYSLIIVTCGNCQMCVKICASNKAQPAIGFPDGWTFYFAGDGLVLISPTQTYYRSLESAIQRANLTHGSGSREDLKREFCAHIGEPFDNNCIEQMIVKSRSTSPKKRARPSIHVAKLELSSKKDIGSRVYCKFTNNAYYWGEIVDKRTLMTGIQYAVQFDDGDFLDHVPDTTDDAEEGNIYTEYGYYERVGVYPPKRQSSLPPAKVRKIDIRLTPAELYEKRCKTCSTCTENDCMRCNSCINNRNNRAKVTECCLRKVSLSDFFDVVSIRRC